MFASGGQRNRQVLYWQRLALGIFLVVFTSMGMVACALAVSPDSGGHGNPGGPGQNTLKSITVKPSSSLIAVGGQQQFTATAKFSNGSSQDVTDSVTWGSSTSSETTVQTVGQASPGLATALLAGTVNITATMNGLTGSASLNALGTVPPIGASLTSISIDPTSLSIGVASVEQFTAVGTYSNGEQVDVSSSAAWTSSDPTIAMIESSGQDNPGRAVTASAGATTITTSMSGQTASTQLSVSGFANPLPAVGGITATPPSQTLGTNQVTDPGFENGKANWTLPTCFSIDTSVAHSGSDSLRYNAGSVCGNVTAAITSIPRSAGAARSYTIQGWVQGSAGTDAQAKLSIHDVTDGGDVVGETNFMVPGTSWQFIQQTDIDLLPIHDGDTLSVQVIGQGSTGTVWFDDVQLIEQLPPPVSSFLLYPNYKGILWGNGPQTIRMEIEVPQPSGMNVTETLETSTGETLSTSTIPAATAQEIDFDATSLVTGSYLIQTALTNSGGQTIATYPAYRVVKVSPTLQSTLVNYIDTDNFLVRNGTKRFVWGVYDRWSSNRCSQCVFTNETGYLQIPGFNGLTTVGSYADTVLNAEMNINPFSGVDIVPPNDQLTPWLQAVDSVGVGHLQIVNNWVQGMPYYPIWAMGMTNQQAWQAVAPFMNGKPGGLGFYTYDEPDTYLIPIVFDQYQSLSSPGTVEFGTLSSAHSTYRWRDMSDVLSSDPYPVGTVPALDETAEGATLSPPMMRTSIWTRATVQQVYASRPVWMVLQLYVLNGQFPTYTQMKTQAYKAIINGANGILWWGFVSEKGIEYQWYVLGNQQPYFDFKQISQEVMGLEPFLILPSQPQLVSSISDNRIEYTVKENSSQIVIVASNSSDQSIGNITFTLSPSVIGGASPVTVYSEARTVPLNPGSTFTDSFAGYDVHVYTINLQ
jgi:Bacterial Ig-like domain (group 2)